jgi:beta-glucosidase
LNFLLAGVMCSYNAVNGIPACADKAMLQGELRGRLNFSGFVASDCGAVFEIAVPYHNYTANLSGAALAALAAGVDQNCGGLYTSELGTAPLAQVDQAVARVLELRVRLGLLDAGVHWARLGATAVGTEAHRDLALRAARRGLVLLKNENATLPFRGAPASLAVIGPFANASKNQLSGYHGTPAATVSVLTALRARLPASTQVTYLVPIQYRYRNVVLNKYNARVHPAPLRRGLHSAQLHGRRAGGRRRGRRRR